MNTPAAADIIASMTANLTAIETAIPNAEGYIMGWPGGLGVRFENGAPMVCGVLHADRIGDADMTGTIVNGKGETARLMERKAALTAAAASIRESIDYVSALAA